MGIVVACVAIAWFVGELILAGREPAPPPTGTEPITLKNGKVTGNRISTRSWTFDYKQAQMSPDGITASVIGVHNGVLYRKGKPYLTLSAQQVSVNTESHDFTAIGTVHVTTISQKDNVSRSFDTDLVQWTNATKILMLSHPSIIRSGDQLLKVATVSVDFNSNEVHLGKIQGGFEAPQ